MKSTMTETKFLIYTVSAILLLMLVRIFQPQLIPSMTLNNYVGIHTVLEIICIAISITIFLYGLKSLSFEQIKQNAVLSFYLLYCRNGRPPPHDFL